jgi:hypothetical protein
MALEVGLFVLGIYQYGDARIEEAADALYGKDSEDSNDVFNAIVSAGDAAHDTRINAERARRRAFGKTAEATSGSARHKVSATVLARRINRMFPVSKNICPEALELWARDLGVLRCDEKVAKPEEAGA